MLRLALGLVLLTGCHARLPKMYADGRYADVIAKAQGSRIRPRKKAARAYAASLHALGRDDQALDALLLDYRRGGDVRSLIAMADLERTLGWRGLAAHHYARALTHDRDALSGRTEVCALFRERAREFVYSAEGEAADADMRRVRHMCPDAAAADAALSAEADAAAQAQVDARIAASQCPPPCEPPAPAELAIEDALAEAAKQSPLALAAQSARLGVQLPPETLVAALLAELQGSMGVALLDDDTIRAWIGDQVWSDLAPAVMSQPGPAAAWVQLRLASIVAGLPRAPGAAGVRELDRWTEQALRVPDAQPWRVYAVQDDVSTAELALSARWRPPKPAVDPEQPAPPRPPVDHWSERLSIDAKTLAPALVAARLRFAAGKADLALRLTRRALTEAAAAGVTSVAEHARDEVVQALGWGRPWHALALLETNPVPDGGARRGAAATAIILSRTMCGGSCRDDEDLGVVLRVMGESWVDDARAGLLDAALAGRSLPADSGRCPTVAEVIEPDADGPLSSALAAATTDLRGPGVGDALADAIAADLRSWCAAGLALPAMAAGDHILPAKRLTDTLAHAPEMEAAGDLATHAKLALVAQEPERAQLMAIAAAGISATPRAVWLDLAGFAQVTASRDLELRALREALMVTPGLRDPAIEQRLVVVALGDVAVSWGQDLVGGREASRRHVTTYLDGIPRAGRWSATEALLAAVETGELAASMTEAERARLLAALGGDAEVQPEHARALLRLAGEDPGPGWGPLHPSGLSDDVAGGRRQDVPALSVALGDPLAFEATRVAFALNARDWSVRRRMAASLVAMGSADARVRGWESLAQMAAQSKTAQRDALEAFVVQRPVSLEPEAGPWGSLRTVSAIEDDATVLRIVLGLDLRGPLVAP
ncbi:MAG: hypothetical protein AAGA54_03215 [Myxococcota bacterium]